MLLLPSGQVLFANGSNKIEVYTPDGAPKATWRPEITNSPGSISPNQTYVLQGRQLNGLSRAVSYGDDAQMATNYPLVCVRSAVSGQVVYCRTYDHSTMGVATGSNLQGPLWRANRSCRIVCDCEWNLVRSNEGQCESLIRDPNTTRETCITLLRMLLWFISPANGDSYSCPDLS